MIKTRVEQFLNEFSRWASEQSDIQGVALVGLYARGTATETSDVDPVPPAPFQLDLKPEQSYF